MDQQVQLYGGDVQISFKESNHSYWIQEEKKRRLTGVTTFLNVINKPYLIPWAVNKTIDHIKDNMEALQSGDHMAVNDILYGAKKAADRERDLAAEIGSAIHKWVEDYINKNPIEMPEDPRVLQGTLAFLEWVDKTKVEFVASEKIVYSKTHDYVGTLDIEAKIKGKRYLIDVKTGNAIYPEARLQTAAYMAADIEETDNDYEGRWILRISKETEEEYIARMEKKGKSDYPEYQVFEAVYLDEDKDSFESDFSTFLSAVHLHRWQKSAKL